MKTDRPLVKSFDQLSRDLYGEKFIAGDDVVADLAKAMSTTGIGGTGDATPLRLENLDGTMTSVLFTESHLKMFQAIPRVPSAQEVYQWIRRLRYGSGRGAVGFKQGGAPHGGTAKWERKFTTNKFLGVRGGYTHQLMVTGQMGGAFVDPVAEENRDRTLELLQNIERIMIFGDKSILDADGNEVHYDGLINQLAGSGSVIDKGGKPLDYEDLENAGERLVTTGKLLNFDNIKTFVSPRVLSDLAKLKLEAERVILGPGAPEGYRPGVPLEGYRSQHGYFPFDESIFLDGPVENGAPPSDADAGAPASPAAVTGAITADAASTLPVATHYYSVTSINDSGESVVTVSAAQAVAAAGNRDTLTISRAAGATGYRVYRGLKSDGSDAKWIGQTAQPANGNATFVDAGGVIPGSGYFIIENMRPEDIAIAQMAPLIKFPLAIINTTIEFLLLLYHVLVVKAPERMIVFKNIGQRA